MTGTARCGTSDLDLLAAACGEAAPATTERIESHLARCEPCREAYTRYRTMDAAIHDLATAASPPADAARERLLESLADLRSRFMRYSVFPTSLGPVLMATTEQGIALVEYVARRDGSDSWLLRQPRVEATADRSGLERFGSELVDYLAGRRTRLEWPLDLRFARSDFQRDVLAATARVPYGAVSSYGGIASDIGRPSAVRAVAGALRHNPLAIVVPCHRIVGSDGALVGYAGTRLGLKERLLGVEGVRIGHRHRDGEVDRAVMYAWPRGSRTYCLPECGTISRQPIGNVTLFASAREAEGLGLAPCGGCRPDLHPLASRSPVTASARRRGR